MFVSSHKALRDDYLAVKNLILFPLFYIILINSIDFVAILE